MWSCLHMTQPDAKCCGQGAAVAACYKLLPAVHRLWKPITGEFDDYIVSPKVSRLVLT